MQNWRVLVTSKAWSFKAGKHQHGEPRMASEIGGEVCSAALASLYLSCQHNLSVGGVFSIWRNESRGGGTRSRARNGVHGPVGKAAAPPPAGTGGCLLEKKSHQTQDGFVISFFKLVVATV